ncbi:MAG: hypothetical protein JW816_04120 [Candidatus Buchananbacteria bacterium]|nr:hypothetical protein [Candidatus Buchananbacteria bacterium]
MTTTQFGSQLISIFSSAEKKLIRTQDKRMIVSLLGAFFIVAIIGLSLSFFQKAINSQFSGVVLAQSAVEEPVAYLPGQFVSSQLQQGYIGR